MSDAAKRNKLSWKKHKKGNKPVWEKKKQEQKNSDQNKDTTGKVSTCMLTKAEPSEDF